MVNGKAFIYMVNSSRASDAMQSHIQSRIDQGYGVDDIAPFEAGKVPF